MNAKLIALGLLASSALVAAPASATQFVGGFTVSTNSGSGLIVDANPSNAPLNFGLNYGDPSYSVALFNLSTPESSLDLDDLFPKAISVAFDFTSPVTLGNYAGKTDGAFTITKLFPLTFADYGTVKWGSPIDLAFGNGGNLHISLSDTTFGLGKNKLTGKPGTVYATFDVTSPDVPSVPEPATWAMMLGGFGLIGTAMRRRRPIATTFA
jgi:PEP-CTERM motif